MRNQFLSSYIPKVYEVDISFPDPNLKKNEDGSWEFSDPDWDEFYRVINGDGPCNAERIAVRLWVETHGKWIREAMFNPEARYTIPLS
jgi:ring-1,2-phenylacetyl-CoA epoxidase subunit PaaA